MSKTRSYAIVAIFVAAAVLTPTPDMMTMALMASPMIILYEICIWLAYFDRKNARIKEEQEARESMERQLLREEKMRAAEAAEAAEAPEQYDDWHDNHPEVDHHAHDAGDDGWHDEYPQHDPHASDVLPEPDGAPPDTIPEAEEPRRIDP